MKKRWVWTALAAAGVLAPAAHADSIWERRDPRYAYLFQDNRARQVGDIVTVVISETTVTNEQDARNMSKQSTAAGVVNYTGSSSASNSAGGGGGAGGSGRSGALSFNLSDQFNRAFTGSANVTMNRVFTDRMAAVVVDVMPNGNLVIEGYRSRVVAGEERVLKVTGIVRQADVGVGNQVPSGSVANFRISYLGRGTETRFTTQNYFGRAMNMLWPW